MSAMLKQKLIDIANGFTKYGLWKGGSETLSELNDVNLTNLQKNDVLTYNGSEWVNDDNLQTQINTLNSNLKKKLLWSNDSLTSSFPAQTISLIENGYDYFEIQYRARASSSVLYFKKASKNESFWLEAYGSPASTNMYIYLRSGNISTDGQSISFQTGYSRKFNATTASSGNNDIIIPIAVYGLYE